MHASFPYESNRGREYGGVRRPDVLIQSHPGLDSQDPLVLHNALSAVDDGQVNKHSSVNTQLDFAFIFYSVTCFKALFPDAKWPEHEAGHSSLTCSPPHASS